MSEPTALAFEDREYTLAQLDALPRSMAAGTGRATWATSTTTAGCAVFSVPDPANGEAVVAAVKVREPVEADELVALVGDRLASYKRPGRVVFVPEIPRLPSGKVLRRVLKERLWMSV